MLTYDLAYRKRVPLLAVETPDQPGVLGRVAESLGESAVARLQWDAARGVVAGNAASQDLIGRLGGPDAVRDETLGSLAEALRVLRTVQGLPWVLVALGSDRAVSGQDGALVAAGLLAHRNPGKMLRQMILLVGPAPWRLPGDLREDVLILSEDLPGDAEREREISRLLTDNGYGLDQVPRAVEATRGLSLFAVEQAAALATDKDTKTIDVGSLWDRARAAIAQVDGLTMAEPSELCRLGDIAGNAAVIEFYRRLFAGPERPTAVVLLDEIEKSGLAHGEGDLSGTSGDQVGVLLDQMERRRWVGALWVGQPGCGKTMLATALAGEFGVPLLRADLGRAKGSLVGESESKVRAMLDTVWSVGGPGAYWCGSSNTIRALPPALVSRFADGRWYFDLLSEAERRTCWDHYCKAFGVSGDRPADAGWSGREIRNCCRNAYRLGCSLVEASAYVVPMSVSDPRTLDALRSEAKGHYLDASHPGVYRGPVDSAPPSAPQGPARLLN